MGSIVESLQDAEGPVFVMPHNQIISVEESIDFPSSNVRKDSRLDDKLLTDAIDLISKLPQHILHHILGFLLAPDTAPVAMLSKTWYQVWNTLPFIDFEGPIVQDPYGKKPWLPFVDSILCHRKNQGVNVDRFRICSGVSESFESYLDHWITTLRDLHVRDLCFHNYFKEDQCTLPESILSVNSINSLELLGFRLHSFQGMDQVNWPLLRKLHLIDILLTDDVIHNIIFNCRAIEDLKIRKCSGLKVINISNSVKLKCFKMLPLKGEFPVVEINIPSLQSFSYLAAEVKYCFSIASCAMLQTLAFSGHSITQGWFDNLFSMFPLLESLTVGKCYNVVKINISSCKLKYFELENSRKVVEVNIDTPNLSTFVYYGTGAISWSINAPPQLQVDVELLESNYSKHPGRCIMVTNFLKMIGRFEVVRLGCRHRSLSFSKEIQDKLIYSQCNLKNLSLDFRRSISKEFTIDDAASLLDNLLCIYSQLDLCIYVADCQLPPFELLFERLNSGEERLNCCDSVPTRCWSHFLKEVKFETVNSDEARRKRIYGKTKLLKFNWKPREWSSIYLSGNNKDPTRQAGNLPFIKRQDNIHNCDCIRPPFPKPGPSICKDRDQNMFLHVKRPGLKLISYPNTVNLVSGRTLTIEPAYGERRNLD